MIDDRILIVESCKYRKISFFRCHFVSGVQFFIRYCWLLAFFAIHFLKCKKLFPIFFFLFIHFRIFLRAHDHDDDCVGSVVAVVDAKKWNTTENFFSFAVCSTFFVVGLRLFCLWRGFWWISSSSSAFACNNEKERKKSWSKLKNKHRKDTRWWWNFNFSAGLLSLRKRKKNHFCLRHKRLQKFRLGSISIVILSLLAVNFIEGRIKRIWRRS